MTPFDSLKSLEETSPSVYWQESADRPAANPALAGGVEADLAVIGGGYSGLWTALLAKEADPAREVVLLEADVVGGHASGRNGGFCDASLTHGIANGLQRFRGELPQLERLGHDNLNAIEEAIKRYKIDCDFERNGLIDVATAPWQLQGLRKLLGSAPDYHTDAEWLDRDQVRAELNSPTYLGGIYHRDSTALLNPAKLTWGLKRACEQLGVRVFEATRVTEIHPTASGLRLTTPGGNIAARRVALGAGPFSPLLKRLKLYVAPVYDWALVTEPLSAEQMSAIGWSRRQGFADAGNQFHYYRLTADNRILWGGWDGIYFFGNQTGVEHEQRRATFEKLAQHFFETFPQLEGLRLTHSWGGVIDTCSRFSPFWGKAYNGRLAYVAGYTGLGVGASRFGAQTMLDLLDAKETERTRLKMVKTKPTPFPPEPLRWPIIEYTRRSLAAADEAAGRRNWWLRLLDKVGLGFTT